MPTLQTQIFLCYFFILLFFLSFFMLFKKLFLYEASKYYSWKINFTYDLSQIPYDWKCMAAMVAKSSFRYQWLRKRETRYWYMNGSFSFPSNLSFFFCKKFYENWVILIKILKIGTIGIWWAFFLQNWYTHTFKFFSTKQNLGTPQKVIANNKWQGIKLIHFFFFGLFIQHALLWKPCK